MGSVLRTFDFVCLCMWTLRRLSKLTIVGYASRECALKDRDRCSFALCFVHLTFEKNAASFVSLRSALCTFYFVPRHALFFQFYDGIERRRFRCRIRFFTFSTRNSECIRNFSGNALFFRLPRQKNRILEGSCFLRCQKIESLSLIC